MISCRSLLTNCRLRLICSATTAHLDSCIKFKLSLDYGWGGNSTLGTAVLTLKNNRNGTADVATAFFGEKWIEADNVRLVDGCWPDWKLERFLVYRLIQKIPKNALAWS